MLLTSEIAGDLCCTAMRCGATNVLPMRYLPLWALLPQLMIGRLWCASVVFICGLRTAGHQPHSCMLSV